MTTPASIEIADSHDAVVADLRVRRALPRHDRRTIGAWCFVDHIGPAQLAADGDVDVAPHPHTGLQTVTWLLEGQVLHRDSLGSEQLIRPGQLNLMTAGQGVAHSEEGFGGPSRRVHGVQLWVAQPEHTRHGEAAFEHHPALPEIEIGHASATVLVGAYVGARSTARADTDHVGIDVVLRRGRSTLPLQPTAEYGAIVVEGAVDIDGKSVVPGRLAYLAPGRDQITVDTDRAARMLLIGGTPFGERISMFWNFVGRTHDEIDTAVREWNAESERFGRVHSSLTRIAAPTPPWNAGRTLDGPSGRTDDA